jgi:lysophospholipase L1-like esterase
MNRLKYKTAILLGCVSLSLGELRSAFAEERLEIRVEKPASMGTLGDSMAAGFLAHFNRTTAKLPWNQALFFASLGSFVVTEETAFMEARELSWSSGLDFRKRVKSHAHRLGFNFLSSRKVINAAVSGAESNDLIEQQIFDLNQKSRRQLKQEFPDYVTFQIGPNDACAERVEDMRSPGEFYGNIYGALDFILHESEKTRVLVPYIPNIERLRAVAKDAKVFPFSAIGIRTCEDLWKVAKVCPTLTTVNDPELRKIVAERVVEYNQAIQDVVDRLSSLYGDRIRASKRVYDVEFTADYLSVDCFHPNKIGQNVLAEETFKDTWWTK